MPINVILPQAATPEQVTKAVLDAANEVIQQVTGAAVAAQEAVEGTARQTVENVNRSSAAVSTAAQNAATELRRTADRAKGDVQIAADQAITDFQRLVSDILRMTGAPAVPAELAIGEVNGEPFFEPVGCFVLLIRAVNEGRNPITIRLRDPAVVQAFRELAGNTRDEVARRARERLAVQIPAFNAQSPLGSAVEPVSAASLPAAMWVLLAVAAVILATAVSVFIVLMAVGIIYAIHKNYNVDKVEIGFNSPLGGASLTVQLSK